MATFAIRIPSVDDLLDPYSAEPLERRPLREEVRERLLREWIDTRDERPSHLIVQLPTDLRRDDLGREMAAAIRNDLERTWEQSGRLRTFSRGERHEAWLAFAFLAVCLFLSSMVDKVGGDDGLLDGISQGIVVLGWVALWRPAQR